MKNGLEVTSQIVDIWENAELMTKKIQVGEHSHMTSDF